MINRSITVIFSVAAHALVAAAQPPDPLRALVMEGLRNNQAIAQERVAQERVTSAVAQAKGLRLPALSLNARYSQLGGGVVNLGDLINPAYETLNQLTGTQRFPTDINATLPFRQETRLSLTQPLYNPAISANLSAARGLANLQGAALRAAERDLAGKIQLAYIGYASAVRAVEVLQSGVDVVCENERVADRLIKGGLATPDVLLRATAERTSIEQQVEEARDRVTAGRRQLNFLLGRGNLDQDVHLVPDEQLPGLDRVIDSAFVARGAERREELVQGAAGVQIAHAQQRLARASFLPTLSLGIDYGIQGNDYTNPAQRDFVVASAVLSWNVFNGGQDSERRTQARLEFDRSRLREEEIRRQIDLQVRNALEALTTAQASVATAQAQWSAADRNLTLVTRRYEHGLATQLEFLDARSAHTRAGINRVLTRYAAAAKWIELERAAALRTLN